MTTTTTARTMMHSNPGRKLILGGCRNSNGIRYLFQSLTWTARNRGGNVRWHRTTFETSMPIFRYKDNNVKDLFHGRRAFSSITTAVTSVRIGNDDRKRHWQLQQQQQQQQMKYSSRKERFDRPTMAVTSRDEIRTLMGEPLLKPAGSLFGSDIFPHDDKNDDDTNNGNSKLNDRTYIPEVSLYENEGRSKKRILILCTGGTLTMAPDPSQGLSLAPVDGALSKYMEEMNELHSNEDGGGDMPDYVLHEYTPFRDSSDLGPADWATLAQDIRSNYLHFDGFVVLTGTDTMAYMATALSFMLENLGKPVIFTGSQIPLCHPYNDARRNLIMAMIFASRDTINEVCIFFHDRLLRANRSSKVNTHRLLAFDSPNLDPLATIGIAIDENEHLVLPHPKGSLRVHTRMDTRLLTVKLVPGFDDFMIEQMISANDGEHRLNALVLELYGTGNIPSVKESFIQLLADASDKGILVVASTQCFTGNVVLGHYATGKALEQAGVISASDMTLEAIACKTAYLFGRGDLTPNEIGEIMSISLRGEVTPPDFLKKRLKYY